MKYLYFSAPWCGPCKMLGPKIDKMASDGLIAIEKVNVDEQEDIAKQFNVRAVPTLVLVDSAMVELGRIIGVKSPQQIKEYWDEHGTTEHTSN